MADVPRLALYASRSCAPRQWHLPTFATAIQKSGLRGVELSLPDLGRDAVEQRESADAIKTAGLHLIVNVSSLRCSSSRSHSSATSAGYHSRPLDTPSDHLKTFESQLTSISALGDVVTHINCNESGDNRWDISAASEYLADVLPLSSKFLEDNPHIGRYGREVDIMGGSPHHLTGISHEMGGGILYCPDQTRESLEILPPLRMTLDISNWYSSMFCDVGGISHDDTEAIKVEIIPHIDHIHIGARILSLMESAANPPSDNGKDEVETAILNYQKTLWNQVWSRKATRGVEEMSITIDAPTTICLDVAKEHNKELLPSVAHGAAKYIQQSFEDWKTGR